MKKNQFENLTQKSDKKCKRKKIVFALISCFFLLPIVAFCAFIAGFAIWANGVTLDKTLLPSANAVATFYDINYEKIDYLTDGFVDINTVPDNLKNAFIALEDKRFYTHKGYDAVRIGGALINNIKSKSIKEGASTITQQLVKNTHLSNERTIKRKLKEIAIATKLEKEYSKDEILAMYLSVIYFGNGAYGVKQASRLYFDKDVDDLTTSECAILAGIVKNPKKYSPFSDMNQCANRRNLVLNVMKNEGYLSEDEYNAALSEEIVCNKGKTSKNSADYCSAYIKYAIDEACDALNITRYQLANSNYEIYTNLDGKLQKSLQENSINSQNFESDEVESVVCIVDNKQSKVIGYYSTLDYEISRQAGSIIKPIAVYAPAIDMGIVSLATPIVDEKIDFGGYSPRNFGNVYIGDTTIREGIKKSINSIAVKTLSYVEVEKSCQYLSKFGVNLEQSDLNLSLALGTNLISPKMIADAYSALANDGIYQKSSFVNYIVKGDRKVFSSRNEKSRAIKSSSASIISSALIDTVKDGTARTLSTLDFQLASKTGTVEKENGNSDAWCISYNDDFTVCVWHGSDVAMSEKGGGYPAMHNKRIWQEISKSYDVSKIISMSDDIEYRDVDAYTTLRDKRVALASQHTPLEYRKTEIFEKGQTLEKSSTFETIDDFDFSLQCEKGNVSITFYADDIHNYRLYRKDIFGETLVESITSQSFDNVTVTDLLLPYFDIVEYRLECEIIANPDVKKSSTKQMFVDDYISNDYFDDDYLMDNYIYDDIDDDYLYDD